MELQEIAQLNNPNDNNVAANTGKRGMLVEMASPEHLIMMPKQFIIPKETDFNLAYIEQKVQEGIFIPVLGASAFEDVSAEDNYNTNSSGVKRLNLKGLVEHRYTFEEGHEFYKQMSRLESYKSFGFAIGDDEGNWALAKNSKGDYLGFTSSHVTPERRSSKQKGGDNEMKSILIQFENRRQWDFDYDLFLAEYLDFNPEEIPTINGVNTSFSEAPAIGDTVVNISVVLSSDHSTPVEGLSADDILLFDSNLNPIEISNVTETLPGQYELTLTNPINSIIQLHAELNGVVNQSGVMYRSNNFIEEQVIDGSNIIGLDVLIAETPVAGGSNIIKVNVNESASGLDAIGLTTSDFEVTQQGSVLSIFSLNETTDGEYEVGLLNSLTSTEDIQVKVETSTSLGVSNTVTPNMRVIFLTASPFPNVGDTSVVVNINEAISGGSHVSGFVASDININLDGTPLVIQTLTEGASDYTLDLDSALTAGVLSLSLNGTITNLGPVGYLTTSSLDVTIN